MNDIQTETLPWRYPKYFYECIVQTEYERDGGYTIIIPPMYTSNWKRSDDTIDYCLADLTDCSTKIKILNEPIYPYNFYMDQDTLEHITENVEYLISVPIRLEQGASKSATLSCVNVAK